MKNANELMIIFNTIQKLKSTFSLLGIVNTEGIPFQVTTSAVCLTPKNISKAYLKNDLNSSVKSARNNTKPASTALIDSKLVRINFLKKVIIG